MRVNGQGRNNPLPWKYREAVFHLGGVLPPTPPLPDGGDNFETFDPDLPPLVPMEESDLLRAQDDLPSEAINHEEDRGSRPARQLRNRSVARSVLSDLSLRTGEFSFGKWWIVLNMTINNMIPLRHEH